MLRKRLPAPLFPELHLTSADPNTGKDFYSPLTDAGSTHTVTSDFKKGRLTGNKSLLQGASLTGPNSLFDDDVLHILPGDGGIPLSSSAGSLSGIVPSTDALSLRPRRSLPMRSIGARRLNRQERQLPSTSDVDDALSNNAGVDQVTELTGLDAVQSTSSGTNLVNSLDLGDLGLGSGLLKRLIKRVVCHPTLLHSLESVSNEVSQPQASLFGLPSASALNGGGSLLALESSQDSDPTTQAPDPYTDAFGASNAENNVLGPVGGFGFAGL